MSAAPWQFLSAFLLIALVGVIVYFLLFHKGETVLRATTVFTQASEDIIVSIGSFTKTLRAKKSGDTYTFTTLDDVAYNFDLSPAPTSYEILTVSENEYYIKADEDSYLRHENGVFSLVTYKDMFMDNTSLSKSMFTIFSVPPGPSYDSIVMGPAKKSRAGGVMESISGDLEKCKMECFSNVDCIGFNTNGTNMCDLKTLNFEVMKAGEKPLGPYVDDETMQYWYKSNTYGNSNTFVGTLGHMSAPTEGWNTDQTFQSCLSELMSPSHSGAKKFGMAYDSAGKQCWFARDDVTDFPAATDLVFTESPTAISMCADPTKDIGKGCA